MSIENTILPVIHETMDPVSGMSLKQLSIVPTMSLKGSSLMLTLKTGFPSGMLQTSLHDTLKSTLQEALPDYDITIQFKHAIQPHRTQLTGQSLRGVKNTIAIASGKGGVGKSTVAVNLATALARAGARVGLLDADIYGPSIPTMLGDTHPPTLHNERYLPVFAHGIHAMSIGYLNQQEGALIWRGPMLAKALIQMLNLTAWNHLDYLFIDLPPGTGDIPLSLVQKIPLTAAIVVTTPQTIATLDAEKALNLFAKTNIDVLGIIENMSLHICSACKHQEPVFGQGGAERLCSTHQIPLLGNLPLHQSIRETADEGHPLAAYGEDETANAFIKTAMHAAIALAEKPLNYADKFPPIVVE